MQVGRQGGGQEGLRRWGGEAGRVREGVGVGNGKGIWRLGKGKEGEGRRGESGGEREGESKGEEVSILQFIRHMVH